MTGTHNDRPECLWCRGSGEDGDGRQCQECKGSGIKPQPRPEKPERGRDPED